MPPLSLTRPLVALLCARGGATPARPGLPTPAAALARLASAAARPPAAVTVPVGAPPPPPAAAPPVSAAGSVGVPVDAPGLTVAVSGGRDETVAPVRLSAAAAARLGELVSRSTGPGGTPRPPTLRLSVDGGGCAGLVYNFTLDGDDADAASARTDDGEEEADEAEEDVVIVAENGATLVVDALSLPYVRGAVVDWEENLVRQAFCVRENDNAEAGCGCGVSFAAKE
ncbi:hypothetical protein BU14_0615s0009 [Porphyra umbilicalis]|uniref:FeS cluster biogenesis domain-containing protein n=1 Tax=Porphyra umbilicalis TaxID=2786 RepID=A0A1X6NR53_PORUM|nr:hypothetical protein BU14_0615s0009 [Porphyra umbilicalis]|eukprot:OSX71020.1 hypothetical protein BU14_0615s0009 [Porphyra umbilicalis]